MAGEAAAIYNVALKNKVNPACVAGLAGAESSFGSAGYARGTHNPYGYGVHQGLKYGSYAQATDAMTRSLHGGLYYGAGIRNINGIINKYTPSSDGNNPTAHVAHIKALGSRTGGDASQVFVDGSGAAKFGDTTISQTPQETGAQASIADTTSAALAGHQNGQPGSIFKSVVGGVVAAQFAVQNGKGTKALNGLTQATNPTPDTAGDGTATGAAKKWLGTPYSWGGGTPSGPTRGFAQGANTTGFDCSSLMQYAWSKAGVQLPRTTYDQIKVGRAVANISQAKPGDLLFPSNHHVQMYLGNGKVIEAPQTGGHVQIKGLRSSYIAIRRPRG
jgi:cell wall-associated NlpC family hydrolase